MNIAIVPSKEIILFVVPIYILLLFNSIYDLRFIDIEMLSCAVTSCKENSGNAIQEGYNVSFHK